VDVRGETSKQFVSAAGWHLNGRERLRRSLRNSTAVASPAAFAAGCKRELCSRSACLRAGRRLARAPATPQQRGGGSDRVRRVVRDAGCSRRRRKFSISASSQNPADSDDIAKVALRLSNDSERATSSRLGLWRCSPFCQRLMNSRQQQLTLTYKQSINCTDSSTPVIDRTLLILLTLLPSIEGVHDRVCTHPVQDDRH